MADEEQGADPRRRAVALAYGPEDSAPRVVARGYGELAERIIAAADREGIYVHGAPELVGLLMQVDVDEQIPEKLYLVIAELLVCVGDIQRELGAAERGSPAT